MPKSTRTVPRPLARATERFETWRKRGPARRKIPDRLWELAAKLGGKYGVNRTAQALRLDYYDLKGRVEAAGTAGQGDEALRLADEYLEKIDAVAIPMSICVGYGGKGAALEATDPDAALAAYEYSVDAARRSGNRFMEALMAPRVAALHARSGEPMVALKAFERMLVSFGEMTDIASVSAWRASLVVLLGKLGHNQGEEKER